jgi:hypothetical protein
VDVSRLAVAPLLLAGGGMLPLKMTRPWVRVAIRLAIVLIPLGIALGLAVAQFRREEAEKSADPYSCGRRIDEPAYWQFVEMGVSLAR